MCKWNMVLTSSEETTRCVISMTMRHRDQLPMNRYCISKNEMLMSQNNKTIILFVFIPFFLLSFLCKCIWIYILYVCLYVKSYEHWTYAYAHILMDKFLLRFNLLDSKQRVIRLLSFFLFLSNKWPHFTLPIVFF